MNTNKNVIILCGTSECIKKIKKIKEIKNRVNIIINRLRLKELSNNTPFESFINNHRFNRLKRGKLFIHDIQQITVLLALYKYGGLYFDLNLNYKHMIINNDNDYNYEWIHNNSMFIESQINKHSEFIRKIMLKIVLEYSSYDVSNIKQIEWPLQLNIHAIVDEIYSRQYVENDANVRKVDGYVENANASQIYNNQFNNDAINDKHYGILSYDYRAHQWYSSNSGDEAQCWAGLQFIPFVDRFVDRDNWDIDNGTNTMNKNETVTTFLNAWYGDPALDWPPNNNINPILLSMHFMSDFRKQKILTQQGQKYFMKYYKKIGPIGARDWDTVNYFNKNGINSYFSGCATALLQNPYAYHSNYNNSKILIIDVDSRAIQQILKLIPKNMHHTIKYMQQGIATNNTKIKHNRMARYDYSNNIMTEIAKSKLLITSRLHSALPGVAMNVSVIFVNSKKLPGGHASRLAGFTDLFHTVSINNITSALSTFDWMSPASNPNYAKLVDLKERMLTDIKKFPDLYENAITFGVVPYTYQ